jgi:nitrite reductase/ring-hydroxylating ferredoxin subunit
MQRKIFIKTCGVGCLGLFAGSFVLQSCTSTRYVSGKLNGNFLEIPILEFSNKDKFRNYVIVEYNNLKYPICVYRQSDSEYSALLMRCTHQGTELQVFGDRLQCPAHGSEFTKSGAVQNGPAETALRTFPVEISNGILKINLS